MKKVILGVVAMSCVFAGTVMAQDVKVSNDNPVKNISVELMGASNGIGIHYDTRFKGNNGWGYSIGAGWGFSQSGSDLFSYADKYNVISVVPRINYLTGRKNRKLELGFGVNLAYFFGRQEYDTYKLVNTANGMWYWTIDQHVKENRRQFFYFLFGNIGYRRQAPRGFLFRVGLSPTFGFGDNHTVDKFYLVPYLSFGKSF